MTSIQCMIITANLIYCLGLDQTKIPLIQETQINKKKQGDCAVLNDLVCELLPLNLNSPTY